MNFEKDFKVFAIRKYKKENIMTEFIQSFWCCCTNCLCVIDVCDTAGVFLSSANLSCSWRTRIWICRRQLVLTFLGASINCYVMFVISRRFGRDWVRNYLARKDETGAACTYFWSGDEKLMVSLVILTYSFSSI